ncbi:hypothetical protein MalM25_27660 [Planctomycetes bacterium MalM25]|nr:hypothetical protein MalM25_27660 [Planctomycetes bacterium MalM25]
MRHPHFALAALVSTLACAASAGAADVLVGVATPAAQRVALDAIDHTAWDALLKRHVNDRGLVDYRAWKASGESASQLDAYLATLSTADLDADSSPDAKLAYWINAYNAVTVKGILREYPTSSIKNHVPWISGYHIWKNLKLRVDGEAYSLDHMEHETLRKLGEPRIHFAIVCASIGCPRLLNEAYVANRLDAQLDTNAHDFFAQSQNFQIDSGNKIVRFSSILKWFGEDFGGSQRARLQRISPWLPTDEAQRLVLTHGVRVRYLDYDWDLNEQK